ncbi:autotransporter assembly complex family protein [Alkalilimnicola ehrlichii]|uniref:autotransporter assembly complex protein TamA n=1 Tax=Alkalilimnicola ehrlichii TaxID=351052 RepID=UPI002162100E|nr:BamA/TamA family outer membrane protein [Alkalilimnicola ehrlichii]
MIWDRAWVNRYGHKFSSDLEVAEVRQSLLTRYIVPLEDPINDTLEFQFGFRLEEFDVEDSERFTAAVQRQQYLGSGWRRSFAFRWERDRFDQDGTRGTTQLFLPSTSWSRTRSRGGVDPYWGDRQLYSLEATHPTLGSDIWLGRARVSMRWLRSFGDDNAHRLLLRGDLGALETESFSETPLYLRFYAGGDQSVRGYAYQSLGPGRYLSVASAEYGYQFRDNWRFALFADGGNAMMSFDEEFKVGTGFGLHWVSPVGPVRLDFAWALREERVPLRLHLSLGTQL